MLKKLLLFILLLATSGLLAQTRNPEFKLFLDSLNQSKASLLSIEEFLKLNKSELYVLDARENEEFDVSHLKSARHVGYFWFDMRKIYDIPFDATVVVYCTLGNRSEKISEKLIHAGYKNVFNLYGGIFEWINEGQPVYKQSGVQTSEIHVFDKNWAQWVEKGTKVN